MEKIRRSLLEPRANDHLVSFVPLANVNRGNFKSSARICGCSQLREVEVISKTKAEAGKIEARHQYQRIACNRFVLAAHNAVLRTNIKRVALRSVCFEKNFQQYAHLSFKGRSLAHNKEARQNVKLSAERGFQTTCSCVADK